MHSTFAGQLRRLYPFIRRSKSRKPHAFKNVVGSTARSIKKKKNLVGGQVELFSARRLDDLSRAIIRTHMYK